MNRQYELIYVLKPDAPEDEVNNLHGQVADVVERMGGKIDKTDQWGRRKLAYEIDKRADGVYHLLSFSAEPETLDEISRVLKIEDAVMRHLATRRYKPGSTQPVAVGGPPSEDVAESPDTPLEEE